MVLARVSKRQIDVERLKEPFKPTFKTAIYARLSSAQDQQKNESIDVQIDIAKKYIETQNLEGTEVFELVAVYSDLGKTGTHFNREAFNQMMQAIRLGEVNCVIVKDLSRFGRNYLEAGNYIEKIFPFLGVRFIAVSDGLDTQLKSHGVQSVVTEIKNLVNDMYAKDFSVKAKVQLQQRRLKGDYVGGCAPYGYQCIRENGIRKLVPDQEARAVIQFIYNEFVSSKSYAAVTNAVNKKKINPPSVYRKNKQVYFSGEGIYKKWDKSSIMDILKSCVYIGNLEQGKSRIKHKENGGELVQKEWLIQEHTHEPLINEEIYQKAAGISEEIRQSIRLKQGHVKSISAKAENIFEERVYCGICGRKLNRRSCSKLDEKEKPIQLWYYQCPQENKDTHLKVAGITEETLNIILLKGLKLSLNTYLQSSNRAIDYMEQLVAAERKKYDKKVNRMASKKDELDQAMSHSYMAYRLEGLPKTSYFELMKTYEEQYRYLEQEEKIALNNRKEIEKRITRVEKIVEHLFKMSHKEQLTKELVQVFVKQIKIYPDFKIEILFNF